MRREAAAHGIEGAVIDALELHKVLKPAAVLDVVEVHGHEFQHTAAPREYVRKPRSEILRGEGGTLGERVKILTPGGVFPLQQREEDLLLGAEIVVYGRAREGRLCADRAQRYVLERECGIELRASVDDLFFSRIREFFRSFWHMNLRLVRQRAALICVILRVFPPRAGSRARRKESWHEVMSEWCIGAGAKADTLSTKPL